MPKINLPDGCTGLDFPDGSKVDGKQGSTVEVSENQARAIDGSWYSRSNVMNSSQQLMFGTPTGMRCVPCKRVWNVWNKTCHKCGEPTTPEVRN